MTAAKEQDLKKLVPSNTTSLWRSVALCCMVAFFEGIDLQAPGVVAPKLAASLHLAPPQLGLFFSSGTLGLFIGAAIGGRLADRFGRRAMLMASVGVFGVFTLATAASNTYPMLVAMRTLTGLGLGGALPNLLALCSESAPPARRRLAVSVMYAGLPIGGAAASLVALLGMAHAGWRPLFVIGGAAPLVSIPPLWAFLPESVVFAAAGAAGRPRPPLTQALFAGGRAPATVLLWVSFFLTLLVFYLLLNWLPSLMIGRGLSRPDAALVQLVFNLMGAGGALAAGAFMDGRWRLTTAAVAFLGSIAAITLMAATPAHLAVAVLVGGLVGLCTLATQSVLYATAPPIYPTAMRGTGVGAGVAMGRLGSVAGPLLAGMLFGQGRSAGQILLAIVPIVAVAGVLACWLIARQRDDA